MTNPVLDDLDKIANVRNHLLNLINNANVTSTKQRSYLEKVRSRLDKQFIKLVQILDIEDIGAPLLARKEDEVVYKEEEIQVREKIAEEKKEEEIKALLRRPRIKTSRASSKEAKEAKEDVAEEKFDEE